MRLNELPDEELVQIATPIMDNLMDGSTERNWEKHTRDFTTATRSNLTEQELLRQCDVYQASHGDFAGREMMGLVRHPAYVSVYWKQRMTKTVGEYLAVLSLAEVDGATRVIRCYVDLWDPQNVK